MGCDLDPLGWDATPGPSEPGPPPPPAPPYWASLGGSFPPRDSRDSGPGCWWVGLSQVVPVACEHREHSGG
eukprot:1972641-Alexandrium_andersonii.AAC.1